MNATEQQLAYRASLISGLIGKAKVTRAHGAPGVTDDEVSAAAASPNPEDWYIRTAGDAVGHLGLALALPDPAGRADCSEQINSLQSGGGLLYAQDHREWGQAVLGRLALILGEWDEHPAVITVAALRAAANGVML